MKRVITYLLAILSGTLLVGCPVKTEYISRSFIQGYFEIDGIDIRISYNKVFRICGTKLSTRWKYCSEEIQEEKYDALCRKHNDMNWNQKAYSYYVIDADFLSIDVVSDADFDETHPAGTSLADMLEFESESLYPFVSGGYQNYYDMQPLTTYIYKSLSDLTIDDMKMLGEGIRHMILDKSTTTDIASLHWLSEPTLSKTHNITVTMISDDGRTFEKTIEVSWE